MSEMTTTTTTGPDDAIADVWYRFEEFTQSSNLIIRGGHLIELSNAVSDLASHHPLFDEHMGEIAFYEHELPGSADAIASVVWKFEMFDTATTETERAQTLLELAGHVSDLVSFHPNHNDRTGRIDGVYVDE